jgi:tRNA 2-(methylsulfanyl)-N6-isopentenyladenosine37 hydroxylase
MIALAPTQPSWIAAALADLDSRLPRLLVDHAHCERKAAAMAIRHVEKHADWPRLAERLSRLAREELVHFERVLGELRGYGAALFAAAGSRQVVDEMLVCALIEARSHERFERLAAALGGTPLGELYADLCDAEARHGELYLDLAAEAAGAPIDARLAQLAASEAEIIRRPGQPIRMHSGG